MYSLENEQDFELISNGYDTLKIFLEKDPELRDKIKNETQFLENKQNCISVRRIICETI